MSDLFNLLLENEEAFEDSVADLFNSLLNAKETFGIEELLFEPFQEREFKIGQYVEVGFGESMDDNDGYSRFFMVDIEGYDGHSIAELFNQRGEDINILYVIEYPGADAEDRCEGMKLSDYLN